jgi:hypothetical protein
MIGPQQLLHRLNLRINAHELNLPAVHQGYRVRTGCPPPDAGARLKRFPAGRPK